MCHLIPLIRRATPLAVLLLPASCGPNPPAPDGAARTPPGTKPAAVRAATPTTPPVTRGTAEAPAPTARPFGGHWVQDWRVRAIMRTIAVGADPAWPGRLPDDPEKAASPADVRRALDDAALLADNLAIAAGQIPEAVADRPMAGSDRAGFLEQARRLREQALQLEEGARAGKVEQMQRTLDGINTTCFHCHTRYRDLTPLLDPGRASVDRIPGGRGGYALVPGK